MKFSFINITEQSGPLVNGYWLYHHVTTGSFRFPST
jgi:hypothetical protein